MKRVINCKLYDTEAAEQIAQYAPNTDRGDFNFLMETLYRTEDGEYFLHGEGGPKTKYAKRRNGGRAGSKEIKPLTDEQALDWCENRSIDGDIVVEEFADLIEV